MKRVWKEKPGSRAEAHYLASQKFHNVERVVAQLLANRGLTTQAEIEDFLNPQYEHSHDPFLLKDMDKAVERIKSAIQRKEKITVYADYDADAVTAAAALLRFFQKTNYQNADYYIPDRFTEGYGINPEAIRTLSERGTNLIITVDCGINAYDAVDLASKLDMDVIITDHHQLTASPQPSPPPRLPDGQEGGEGERVRGSWPRATAVVNPHRPDDNYPFKDLTGVGVAFKLAQALCNTPHLTSPTRGEDFPSLDGRGKGRVRGWEKWLLDLVAIGTVADCQSLLGENRIFVKWGMFVMQKTKWVGLRKLIEAAGLAKQEFDTYKIGFIIAPRINAAGRIEHANLALELLLTDNADEAQTLADKLDKLNRHRQELTEQILSEAREQLLLDKEKKILLAQGEEWPKGIVGLVAGRLVEEFYRPVLVLSRTETEAVGSARSISGFNIVEAISQSRQILVRYGGHAQAAGFTLDTAQIDIFHKNLLTYAEAALPEESLSPVLYYDAEIKLADIKHELVETLQKFEPYGQGNPRPRFRINNLAAKYIKKIGNDEKHLRMYISDESENQKIGCIGFRLGFWADKVNEGDKIDIICEPQWNEWNGERKIQLRLIDIDYSQ